MKVGQHQNLSRWISLLSRFNQGHPLNKELITKIEDFFNFYWDNNRLSALNSDEGKRFITQLPESLEAQILIDYLFVDFLYRYKSYFTTSSHIVSGEKRLRVTGSSYGLANPALNKYRLEQKVFKER